MRELLGELFVTRLDIALRLALPYLIVGFFCGIIAYGFIYLGRRIERFEWCRELEKGNRMGDVVKEKIGKRDARNRVLTKRIAADEAALDMANKEQLEINGLLIQIFEIVRGNATEKVRRRRA